MQRILCGLCVPPIGVDAILRCGQLGVDMAGMELAASDIIVLAGGYWARCWFRLRQAAHAAGDVLCHAG